MAVSFLVAIGTFLAVTTYVSNVNTQVGERVTVYQAKAPIDPYVPLSAESLVAVEVPRRWASDSAIVTLSELAGRRIGFRVNEGTTISKDMLIANTALSSTERELAINVNPVTGVAGRVRPGDRVDVYAIFGDVPGLPKQVRVLERNVRIVSIAGEQTVTQQNSQGMRDQQVIPITLAVEPNAALAISYASAFAQEVRLVALPSDVGVDRAAEDDTFDASKLGGQAIPEGQR